MRLQSDSNQVLGHVSIDCKDVSGCLDSIMVHLLGEGNSFSGNVFSAVDGKVCRRRVYAVNEPIHYLAFHDNCSLVILLHHAADGKVTLMLMPLHGHGSDQSIDQVNNKFSLTHNVCSKEEFASKYSPIEILGRDRLFNKLCMSSNSHNSLKE
jgi:hypothetical protein